LEASICWEYATVVLLAVGLHILGCTSSSLAFVIGLFTGWVSSWLLWDVNKLSGGSVVCGEVLLLVESLKWLHDSSFGDFIISVEVERLARSTSISQSLS